MSTLFFSFLKLFSELLNIVVYIGHTVNMHAFDDKNQRAASYDGSVTAEAVQKLFSGSDDFQSREIRLGLVSPVAVTVCWIDGSACCETLNESVLHPLSDPRRLGDVTCSREAERRILLGGVYTGSVVRLTEPEAVARSLSGGFAAVIFDATRIALCFEVKAPIGRPVAEAQTEKSVKGARDAFVETLRVNTALIRRRLTTPRLQLQEATIGTESACRVTLFYIEGAAPPAVLDAVRRRLGTLDPAAILGEGDLEPQLVHGARTVFPLLEHTERPDKFAAALLRGRVGLIADGMPVGFLLPVTLAGLMRTPEDRAAPAPLASLLAVLRYAALLIATLLPAIYVAAVLYHREMIPMQLLQSFIRAEADVPFAPWLVMLGLLAAFELLQEAGLRLPAAIGQTVSIIGALLIGEAAVQAKLASPIAIVIVAVSGIAGYNLPSQELANTVRALRLALVIPAALAGLLGLSAATAGLIWHLATLESLGVAYLYPFADGDGGLRRTMLFRARGRESEEP